MNGIIIKAISGFYYVSDGEKTYECKAKGSFRASGVSPLVGDRVRLEITEEEKGVVTAVLPRKNQLSRPPVANIDKLFIVSSYEKPAPNAYIIDKLTAIAEYKKIEPVIVFNKCDMGGFDSWERIYKTAGFKVFTVSAENGEGTDALKCELKDCVSAFTGNSGVGKSSILNVIFGDARLSTGAVSDKLGRGRHTTRHTELFALPFGGFVADTPGFSSLENDCQDYEFKESLVYCFRDLSKYADGCRFSSCTHTVEKGCCVLEAVKNGEISESRHKSYIALFEELKALKPWNALKHR
ncbi:MAG: ribosome small subunit-dependent GTPase A [Acutalibacteraceae bacterium]